MMYQSYTMSQFKDDNAEHMTTFTVADDEPVNCAHMLASAFNTMSRNVLGDCVLGVVDTKAGTVQYDGKIEQIKRDEPWSISQTFNIEPSADGDTLISLLHGEGATTYTVRGDVKFHEEPEPSKYAHIAREVLESSYAELEAVRKVLEDAGVETIPPSAGVRDLYRSASKVKAPALSDDARQLLEESYAELQATRRALAEANIYVDKPSDGVRTLTRRLDHEFHARTNMEQQYASENASALAEMVQYVKAAHVKRERIDPHHDREGITQRWSGMLDVLAKFLVVTGEADADEGHAVARRLCGIED